MTSSASRRTDAPSFDRCAARYDELRPVDANWWELYERIAAAGELRGRRALEVGCGTGRLSAALAERALARVWAVDASAAMVERARALGVNARVARAEALPFKAGAFGAVVMRMVVHLLERPRALAEAARVLRPGGRLYFYEHVRSGSARFARAQRALDLIWPLVNGGCHLARDTERALAGAGFAVEDARHFEFLLNGRRSPSSPTVIGVAARDPSLGQPPAP